MSQLTNPATLHDTLLGLASTNQLTNLSGLSTLTWIVYDIIIFFDQEVALIWHCHSLSAFGILGPMLQWMATDIVWLIRLKALYGNKKKVFKGILFFWFISASFTFSLLIYAFFVADFTPAPPPFSSVTGCLLTSLNYHKLNLMKFPMISTMTIHVVFLTLILYKFQQHHIVLRNVCIETIMSAFIADGIVYYMGLAVAVIFQIVTTSGGTSLFRIDNLSVYWLGAFYSFAGSHLILHLRAVNSDPGGLSAVSHSIKFGHCTDVQRSDAETNAVEITRNNNHENE
ncbi:hypothetical protein GALMADRAFT_145826 [Galerina marginata CBS 339.88]|uniref:DUF6533 domain-containing protein n=1 Tax=Galerina marginata (strain CBS 339.88) TaxID=685588 RepID=A0A067SGG8_GALM3|nr:hypothetical protein GALMADRAFT_145826 [Galerina marginata CBS 339.88]